MTDLCAVKFIANANAAQQLYPDMCWQYSKTGPPRKLDMVRGDFTTPAASSSSAQASSGSSSKPVQVQLEAYSSKGYPCYSWIMKGKRYTSYANDWHKITYGGKPCLHYKPMNLIAKRP